MNPPNPLIVVKKDGSDVFSRRNDIHNDLHKGQLKRLSNIVWEHSLQIMFT